MKKNINNIIIGILSIVLFLVPLLSFPIEIVFDYDLPRLIILYIVGTLLGITLILKRKELKWDKKDILMLIFLLLAEISMMFSIDKWTSVFGKQYRYEGFLMILTYILVYYFAKYYFRTYKNFYKILFGIVTFIGLLAIMQFYDVMPIHDLFNLLYEKNVAKATFGNQNFLGSYITLFLPIFMCVYVLSGKKRFLAMSNIMFLAMLCSLTRSAWLAFFVYSIIGIIYVIYKKEKTLIKNSIILLLTFIITFGVGDILSSGRITGRNTKIINEIKTAATEGISNSMGSGRIEIWKVTLNTIKMHPIKGCGIDALEDAIMKEQTEYFEYRLSKIGNSIDKAHNEYLQIAATMGIPALIIYLLFIFFIIKDNMKEIFKNKIILFLSLSIIGYLVQAFFNISTIGVAPIFWILLGLIQNREFIEENQKNI